MAGGTLNDRYQLDRYPVAHSGMAEVWPARDVRLDRPVIIKILTSTANVDLVRRFRREALLHSRLTHPGVPRIFDMHHQDGRPYLVLEKIDGVTLADLSNEQGPLPIDWVASIGAQIAAVLSAAHHLGLVHRDVKPSNVMLEPSGAVRVLDFGLAAALDDERYSRITETGQSLGTVGYMAPEQINADPVDHRADLYGLGATLYHLVTGEPPFDGLTTITTARRQLVQRPERTTALRAEVPTMLDELIDALLAVDPADRPASADAAYATLIALAGPPPPVPGVISAGTDAVRSYAAAIIGRPSTIPQRADDQRPTAGEPSPDEASRRLAAGQPRAAARIWRQLADRRAQQVGEDDGQVFEWRHQAARADIAMGERSRALRQLETLLDRRIRAVGPDHASVKELQRDIADLRG